MADEEFSSGILMGLVVASLKAQGLWDDVAADIIDPAAVKAPHIQLSVKRRLLERVYARHGAAPIIRAGFDIQTMPENPLSFAMLRAVSVSALIDRFFKLEKYFHSKHRLVLTEQAEGRVVMTHMSTTASKPMIYEDLLLGGLMAGILSQYGCVDVRLDFSGIDAIGSERPLIDFQPPEDCSRFCIQWTDLQRTVNPRLRAENQRMADFAVTGQGTISAKVEKFVAQDPIEKCSLDQMAGHLRLSSRTLQRRLKDEGTTLGECILSSRCRCATYYMMEESESLTSVGFLAGFSDAAHFSREFRKKMGLSPSNFQSTLVPNT